MYLTFVVLWLVNSLLLYLANMLYPQSFVLGTHRMSVFWSGIAAGFIWTLLSWIAEPLRKKIGLKLRGALPMLTFYFLANFVALWLTARIAPLSGFGTASFVWVAALAFVGNVAQYLLFTGLKLKA